MAEKEPAEQPYLAEDATPPPWAETGAHGALHFVAVAPRTDHGFIEARKLEPPGEWAP